MSVPTGHRRERGYLNGVPIEIDYLGGELVLEVSPSKADEGGGTLELVLVSPDNDYFLSGELALPLPMASW